MAYYADPHVRDRIREYCGASRSHGPTCAFVSQLVPDGFATWDRAPRAAPRRLPALWRRGWDISRSLEDSTALIVHLEVDYANPDAPGDALLRPGHTFVRVEPVYQAISHELARLDLPLLDVMTGRGYHFAGRVPRGAPVVTRLARLAPASGPRLARAHAGLGLLMEYLGQRVLAAAAGVSAIPVVFNGTEVGQVGIGREAVSLDLSEYGDPLSVRQLRVAFGTYQSHQIRPDVFGVEAASRVPAIAAVPRRSRPLVWMLEHGRRLEDAALLARSERAGLPTITAGLEQLLDEYQDSLLHSFHRDFYAVGPHGADDWPATYDRLDLTRLVPCVRFGLERPNDALLKPTVLQHVTRALLADGWHPRHIAGLVWSKYARDFGWGDRWERLNAAARADFDVRVFAGLVATGLDAGIDLNCVSAQEKGLCPRTGCPHDLRETCARLLQAAV